LGTIDAHRRLDLVCLWKTLLAVEVLQVGDDPRLLNGEQGLCKADLILV